MAVCKPCYLSDSKYQQIDITNMMTSSSPRHHQRKNNNLHGPATTCPTQRDVRVRTRDTPGVRLHLHLPRPHYAGRGRAGWHVMLWPVASLCPALPVSALPNVEGWRWPARFLLSSQRPAPACLPRAHCLTLPQSSQHRLFIANLELGPD